MKTTATSRSFPEASQAKPASAHWSLIRSHSSWASAKKWRKSIPVTPNNVEKNIRTFIEGKHRNSGSTIPDRTLQLPETNGTSTNTFIFVLFSMCLNIIPHTTQPASRSPMYWRVWELDSTSPCIWIRVTPWCSGRISVSDEVWVVRCPWVNSPYYQVDHFLEGGPARKAG